jgi:hypothetical protein
MSAKMRDLHDVQYCGLRDLLYPRLGDYVSLLPSRLHQVSMRCEHCIVLSVSEFEFIVVQRWDFSQLDSFYMDPLWDVCGDQNVLKVLWDVVMVNHASERRDVIR